MADSSVAVVVVAHAPLAGALKDVAEHVFGDHVHLTAIDVLPGACADDSTDGLLQRVLQLNQGAGVLLLTDLPGASPANICVRTSQLAAEQGIDCAVVAGVNAAMVVRALNYQTTQIDEMVQNAIDGACQSVRLLS